MKVDDRAYPLYWPEGVKRATHRPWSKFKATLGIAREELLQELKRLGAQDVIISTNLPLRNDGLFRIDDKKPSDPGVAVYFKLKGQPRAMCCDRWSDLASNIHALALSIEAIRGLSRWGSSDMVERAFAGFTALPAPAHDWRVVLGFPTGQPPLELVRERYKARALAAHPDHGGNAEEMIRLNQAMQAAERELQS